MRRTVKCAAADCPNRTDKNISKEISFHGFPLDSARKAQWVSALNRANNWKPTTQSILCSEHFRPEDLDRTSRYVRVQRNAIPSIFPHQLSSQQKKVGEIEQPLQENSNTSPNLSNNRRVELVYESSSDDSLSLDVFPEELSPAQLNFRNRHNNEVAELNQRIKELCNQPNVEVIHEPDITLSDSFPNTSSDNRKRKRSISETSLERNNRLKLNNNPQIVANPKQCVVMGTLTSAVNLPLNLKPNVPANPKRKRRGRKPRVPEKSTPKDISFNESRAFGGLIVGTTYGSNAKLQASQMVVAKPHLVVKEVTEYDQIQLDTHVKIILSHSPKELTEWLIKQGLLKSSQVCICHPSMQLKLTLYNDISFPCSGGYLWFSDCCPDKIVSVYNGSLFECSPYEPTEILNLIYHWCCQTNFKDVVQFVVVDNSHMRLVNSRLRAICTLAVQADVGLLGGPEKKVEIGITTLMGTQLSHSDKRGKVAVLGVLEPETKQIRLCVLESTIDADSHSRQHLEKILEYLSHWIHPESVLAIDTTMDKNALFNRGFTNIQQSASTDQNPCNESIMKYLREILPPMFEKTFSLLTVNVIQQFLDELVWRERYGTTPSECFSNIIIHISQQSVRLNSMISRLGEVSADPFKNWRPQKL